jgi:hypothetical protein
VTVEQPPPPAPKEVAVPTGAEHTFHLLLPWEIDVEKEGGGELIQEVVLAGERGGYRHRCERSWAKDGGTHWIFRFPEGPRGDYRVDVRSGNVTHCAWRGLRLPCEHGELDVPTAPPPGPPVVIVVDPAQDE